MRSVSMRSKRGRSETNGSEGEPEENGGTVLSSPGSSTDEVREGEKNTMSKGKRGRASRKKSNGNVAVDDGVVNNSDDDDAEEHQNGNVRSNKRQKRSLHDKPTSSHDDDDDDSEKEEEEKEKNDDGDDDDDEEYEVEKIVAHDTKKGKRQFLVRWKGYDADQDTWEQEKDLSCPELIDEYLASIDNQEENEDNSNESTKNKQSKKTEKKTKKRTSKSNKNASAKNDKSKEVSEDGEDEEDGVTKQEYEVEKILDVYFKKNKEREFLIRWKGFTANDDTWEPEEHLNCSKLIEAFMAKVEKAKSINPRELRTNPQHTKRYTLSTADSGRRLSRRNVGKQRATYFQCDE